MIIILTAPNRKGNPFITNWSCLQGACGPPVGLLWTSLEGDESTTLVGMRLGRRWWVAMMAFGRVWKFPLCGDQAHKMWVQKCCGHRMLQTSRFYPKENLWQWMLPSCLTLGFTFPTSWNRLCWHQPKTGLCSRSARSNDLSDNPWWPGTASLGGSRDIWITSPDAHGCSAWSTQ